MCHKQVDKETVVKILALQLLIESHLLSVIHYFILTSVDCGRSGGQPKSAKAAESSAIFLRVPVFLQL